MCTPPCCAHAVPKVLNLLLETGRKCLGRRISRRSEQKGSALNAFDGIQCHGERTEQESYSLMESVACCRLVDLQIF